MKRETYQILKKETPISYICFSTLENRSIILISTSDAHLLIYELIEYRFELINRISLEKIYSDNFKNSQEVLQDNESQASLLCIGLQLFSIGNNSRIEFNRTRKNVDFIIACATTACLMFIEFNTGSLIYLVDFKSISADKHAGNLTRMIPQVVEFSIVNKEQLNVAFLLLFQNEINVVKCADICLNQIEKVDDLQNESTAPKKEIIISVVSK